MKINDQIIKYIYLIRSIRIINIINIFTFKINSTVNDACNYVTLYHNFLFLFIYFIRLIFVCLFTTIVLKTLLMKYAERNSDLKKVRF